MQRLIRIALSAAIPAIAGCAVAPAPVPGTAARGLPELRLAPALLGHPLALQQRLTVHAPGQERQLDVLLEADAARVQLGVVAMGQVAARLSWDGTTLDEQRSPFVPKEVSAARILTELQLTLWPADAIRAALPAGWRLAEAGDVRTLSQDGEVVAVVTRVSRRPDVVEIDQRRDHYRLTIESKETGSP